MYDYGDYVDMAAKVTSFHSLISKMLFAQERPAIHSILSTTLTLMLCLTNHPLRVVQSFSSAGMKSNRLTSEGTSFVISSSEMFLPMQDLDPAPNYPASQ